MMRTTARSSGLPLKCVFFSILATYTSLVVARTDAYRSYHMSPCIDIVLILIIIYTFEVYPTFYRMCQLADVKTAYTAVNLYLCVRLIGLNGLCLLILLSWYGQYL